MQSDQLPLSSPENCHRPEDTYAKAVLLTRALHVPVVGEDVDLFGDTGLAVTRLYRNRSSGAPGQVSGGNWQSLDYINTRPHF